MSLQDDLVINAANLIIKLLINSIIGPIPDGLVKSALEELGEKIGEEKLKPFQKWLQQDEALEKFQNVIKEAEKCFKKTTSVPALGEAINQVSFKLDPTLLKAIEEWQKKPITAEWHPFIQKVFERDHGRFLTEQEIYYASLDYEKCLRKHLGLLGNDPHTPNLVLSVLEENEKILHQLETKIDQIKNILTTTGKRSYVYDALRTHYLGAGTEQDPARPFGGRQAEIQQLNDWLGEEFDDQPYMIMTARAGKGKTALLLHWLEQPNKDEVFADWGVAYYPISQRFETNLGSEISATLAEQLGVIYNQDVNVAQSDFDNQITVNDFLKNREPTTAKKVLVVVDGLDEADNIGTIKKLFQFAPPKNVRILVSARTLAETEDEKEEKASKIAFNFWAKTLGWKQTYGLKHFPLVGLDREGIANVLESMGNPLDDLGSRKDVIEKLFELSEQGDPLIIELYIEELKDRVKTQSEITIQDLENLEPGFEAFFDYWMEAQEYLWRKQGIPNPFSNPQVLALRDYCSFAKAALSSEDLMCLASGTFTDPEQIVQAYNVLRRFIIRRDTEYGYRYVYAHPRLGDYFRNRRKKQGIAQKYQDTFVEYGRETIQSIANNNITPKHAAQYRKYIIQYYSDHLDEVQAESKLYYELISKAWLDAWLSVDGTATNFLHDVDKAWEQARQELPRNIPIEILAALCHSSVKTQSTNIGTELILVLWKREYLSTIQAANLIEQIPNPIIKIQAWLDCFDVIRDFPLRQQDKKINDLLTATQQIADEFARASILSSLAEKMEGEQRQAVEAEALAVAQQITNESDRAWVLSSLAEKMEGEQRQAVEAEALAVAQQITDEPDRVRVLSSLAQKMEGDTLNDMLAAAQQITDEPDRAWVLISLAEKMEGEKLNGVLAAAQQIADKTVLAWVLISLAEKMKGEQRQAVEAEALAVAQQITDEPDRVRVLSSLAQKIEGDKLNDMLVAAQQITDEPDLASVLISLAEKMEGDKLNEVLAAAQQITDEYARASVLSSLAEKMEGEQRQAVEAEALAVAHQIASESARVRVLRSLAEKMEGEQRQAVEAEALAAAQQIASASARASVLISLAEKMEGDKLNDILAAAQQIPDETNRASVLNSLAQKMEGDKLNEVLAAAQQIESVSARASVLSSLAEKMEGDKLNDMLTTAQQITDETNRAWVLNSLAQKMEGEQRQTVEAEALAVAQQIANEYVRASVLSSLAQKMEGDKLNKVLAAAQQIADKTVLAWGLSSLAEKMEGEQRQVVEAEALAAAQQIADESPRASVLSFLAEKMEGKQRQAVEAEALTAAQQIADDYDRAWVLSSLAEKMEGEQRQAVEAKALAAAQQIASVSARASVLSSLAQKMEGDKLNEVLAAAQQIADESARASVLSSLAQKMEGDKLNEVLAAAQQIADESDRAWVLNSLTHKMEGDKLNEVLAAAQQIADEFDRASVLSSLVQKMEGDKLNEVLAAVQQIADESARASVLSSLAEKMEGDKLNEVLAAAQQIADESDRAWVLNSLTHKMEGDKLNEVLAAAQQIASVSARSSVLNSLVEKMEGGQRQAVEAEVLAAAQQITDESARASVLSSLAEKMQDKRLKLIYLELPRFNNMSDTLELLQKLETQSRKSEMSEEILNIPELIQWYSKTTRETFLRMVEIIAPYLKRIVGDEGLVEIVGYIKDIGQWWP